jgi:spore maturation protein SpmA/spore maturation protein SpmB
MLNWIWLALILAGALIAGFNGRVQPAVDGAFASVAKAVELSIGLAGVMTLWLGLMRLAEVSGLVQGLARWLRPVLVRLFPEVPANHPAMGSMVLNLAANALGLTNAATPLGLRAMRDLESLNQHPGSATNAMCTFLALNTGSVQLLPITAIAVLAQAGAQRPTAIIGTTLLATFCSSLAGLIVIKLLARLPIFQVRPDLTTPRSQPAATPTQTADLVRIDSPLAGPLPARLASAALVLCFGWFAWNLVHPATLSPETAANPLWMRWLNAVSLLAVPFLLAFFPLYAALRRISVYEQFIEGAKDGFQTSVRIIPYLVAMLVAIGFFRGAGGIELLTAAASKPLGWLDFPPELLPMALLRPLTGSGTLAALSDLVRVHGPDSLLARMGGTLFGSTETTFYVISVYFGAVGVRRTRHAIWAGLAADLVGAVAAVWVCRMLFGAG